MERDRALDSRRAALSMVLLVLLAAAAYLAYRGTSPRRMRVWSRGPDLAVRNVELPFRFAGEKTYIDLSVQFDLPRLHARVFDLHYDDCISELAVNGKLLAGLAYPLCRYPEGHTVDLGEHLRPGENRLNLRLVSREPPGVFDLRVAGRDPVHRAITILVCCILLLVGLQFVSLRAPEHRLFWGAGVLGCVLRFLYYAETPYWLRAYDWGPHLNYIRFVSENWQVPAPWQGPVHESWEYHQSPLYYFLMALWLRLANLFGAPARLFVEQAQFLAFLISAASLLLALLAVRDLLHDRPRYGLVSLPAALFAAFCPALVFFASRISNDGLVQLFNIALFWRLVHWRRTAASRDWVLMMLLGALGILTKLNAAVFAALPFILLPFERRLGWRRKAVMACIGLAIMALSCGWYAAVRVRQAERQTLMGAHAPARALRLENDARYYLTFNPAAVLRQPFNNPWRAESRRAFFWEYLLRSAFFGEFSFPRLALSARLVLLSAMCALPLLLLGCARSLRASPFAAAPVHLLGAALLLSLLYVRLRHPYPFAQDFRFVDWLVVPLGYYAA